MQDDEAFSEVDAVNNPNSEYVVLNILILIFLFARVIDDDIGISCWRHDEVMRYVLQWKVHRETHCICVSFRK